MKTEFRFRYGQEEYTLAAQNGAVYELEQGVTVRVEKQDLPAYDAAEWVLYFRNQSDKNSQIFSDIQDCDTLFPLELPTPPRAGYRPVPGDACVITMTGMVAGRYYWENDKVSATEYSFNYEYLEKTSVKEFANTNGLSSEGMMPFFDITASGAGYITAIGWTGDWKAKFSKEETGIRMVSGLKETNFYLLPGETVRTTSTLVMGYTPEEDKYNKFRGLIRDHFSHKANTAATRDGLMACELWGGLPSEEMKKRLDQLKAYGIAFEDVWLDAGWYGQCEKCDEAFTGDWWGHTGEWEVNARVHPSGLKDVAACAQDAGMKLMLWIEPERAVQTTKIAQGHPDWFLFKEGATSALLNYGNPEAFAYILDTISDYARKLELSCYRQDFNTPITDYFQQNDPENRRGITEIKHITGMYRLWDTLLEQFPGLIIDNCSGGGRRIDIEALKRSIPFFRSDYQCNFNENPEVLQVHNANIACYLPYNGCTSKTKSDTYAIRSSYSSSWGGAFYNAVFQSMEEADFQWAKQVTDEYRKIRKYFSKDFYNHGSCVLDDTAWAIWQYHDPQTKSGIVMAFRRGNSPFDQVTVPLKGMDSSKPLTCTDLNTNAVFESSGDLTICLPEKRSSIIVEYQVN